MSPRSSEKKPKSKSKPKAKASGAGPEPDIYVGLLFVAVSALITGCIFLALELNKYNWQMAPQGSAAIVTGQDATTSVEDAPN